MSAPVGLEPIFTAALLAVVDAFTGATCGEEAFDAALSSAACSLQCFVMASQALCTEPPTDKVDLLKIESPLLLTKTAILSLWDSRPWPPPPNASAVPPPALRTSHELLSVT